MRSFSTSPPEYTGSDPADDCDSDFLISFFFFTAIHIHSLQKWMKSCLIKILGDNILKKLARPLSQ